MVYKNKVISILIIFSLFISNYSYGYDSCENVNVNGDSYTVTSSGNNINIQDDPTGGFGCTPVDWGVVAGVIGVLVVVSWLGDLGGEESDEDATFSAYSSSDSYGLKYNKISDNYFLRLSAPKQINLDQLEDLDTFQPHRHRYEGVKLEFGFKF
jgi:hypothetical protein